MPSSAKFVRYHPPYAPIADSQRQLPTISSIANTLPPNAANSVSMLLSNPKLIRSTLRYIAATQRSKDYLDVGPDPKKD